MVDLLLFSFQVSCLTEKLCSQAKGDLPLVGGFRECSLMPSVSSMEMASIYGDFLGIHNLMSARKIVQDNGA